MRMESFFRVISLFLGGLVGLLFGGKSVVLGVLLGFTIADYITGLIAGGSTVGLSSKVGFRGIRKKVTIFIIVAVAHGVDIVLGSNDMFRDAAVFFYIANEVISILENASRMNVLVPNKFQEAIKSLLIMSEENKED
ncbi:phage holin family protein [Vagococcus sp. DIV0080]|uniref:Phage holin family protein n=1 Tax=Candidatus Vagococcus giribetii TaxID=2230876 RepID=A0ABS3HVU4_9ENTE|nr:phage holin family protein [Vagococcus sp. DIV0080]MBO0477884.1 phage holin family protein [Vagococcus sp. DIV0080]